MVFVVVAVEIVVEPALDPTDALAELALEVDTVEVEMAEVEADEVVKMVDSADVDVEVAEVVVVVVVIALRFTDWT
ncbi:hypothetical protein ANO11243_043790 [Dothideomycetidae sp. 11243]|nr:hypothetical protein ANO11243_043790 [fungal sp. No.11243]